MSQFQDFCHLACFNEANLIQWTHLDDACDFCGQWGSRRTGSNNLYSVRDKKIITCSSCDADFIDIEKDYIKFNYINAMLLNKTMHPGLLPELHNSIINILIKVMLADVTDRWDNQRYPCEDAIESQE